jgi:hypothetical protein
MALLKVAAGLIVLPFDNVRKREAIADIGDCWPSSRASQRAARSIGPGTGLATSSDPAAGHSIFTPPNRTWLTSAFGIQFLKLDELAAKL